MTDEFEPLTNDVMNSEDSEHESLKERALRMSLEEMFSTENMPIKSDLTPAQIMTLSRGMIFAEKYRCKSMQSLVDSVLQLSVSKQRQGRKEFVQLVRSGQDETETEANAKSRSFLEKMLGR